MPAQTPKQQRFAALCSVAPEKAHKKCMPPNVAREFAKKPPGGYRSASKRR